VSRAIYLAFVLILSLAVACSGEARRTVNNDIVTVDLLLSLEPAFGGRGFNRPLEVGAYPGGQMFVAQHPGSVLLLRNSNFT